MIFFQFTFFIFFEKIFIIFAQQLNKKALTIDGYQDVAQEKSALLCAVARQPISVGIDGKSLDFQLYAAGVTLIHLSFL